MRAPRAAGRREGNSGCGGKGLRAATYPGQKGHTSHTARWDGAPHIRSKPRPSRSMQRQSSDHSAGSSPQGATSRDLRTKWPKAIFASSESGCFLARHLPAYQKPSRSKVPRWVQYFSPPTFKQITSMARNAAEASDCLSCTAPNEACPNRCTCHDWLPPPKSLSQQQPEGQSLGPKANVEGRDDARQVIASLTLDPQPETRPTSAENAVGRLLQRPRHSRHNGQQQRKVPGATQPLSHSLVVLFTENGFEGLYG